MSRWLALCLMLAALACCATSEGVLLAHTQDTIAKDTQPDKPPPDQPAPAEPDEEVKGLSIRTDPPGAVVKVGLEILGITPLDLEDLEPGTYNLTIESEGYRTITVWVDYDGTPLVYAADMERITGFLQVTGAPAGATVTVDGSTADPAGEKLPVGRHDVLIRAFGYVEHREEVQINEDAITTIAVTLEKAPFALTSLDASRVVFNPANFGVLGQTMIRFSVTGPGSAVLEIRDEAGRLVFRQGLPDLRTWDQSVAWTGRDTTGAPLASGAYGVRVSGQGADGSPAAPREIEVRIDADALIEYRSLASGAAGLVYVPTPQTLPQGAAQISALALANVQKSGDTTTYLIPVALGFRLGLDAAEIDVQAGTYLSSSAASGSLPLYASLSARHVLGSAGRSVGVQAAAGARVAYHALSTDMLTNFTGLALEAPVRLWAGPVSLLLSPELIASYRRVDAPGEPAAFWVWGYGRAGLSVSVGPFVGGLSAALRLRPFTRGIGIQTPIPVAAEAHLTLPGTSIILSVVVAAEVESASSYYVMGGGGFGVLF